VALTIAAIALGYAVAQRYASAPSAGKAEPSVPRKAAAEPWYRSRPPPPSMVTVADRPLFPDDDGEAGRSLRPYEEALPKEIYEPEPVPPAPPPASARPVQPARPAEPAVAPPPVPAAPGARPPWQRFAVTAPAPDGRPRVAIVIDDMGIDRKRSAEAMRLPGPLTLSFLTYAEDLDAQTREARSLGHELMLHVAMEPGDASLDAGPNVLLTGLSPEDNRKRLAWGMERFEGYVGVNNHMGSKFTRDEKAMAVVIEEVKRRGLLFLDSRTSGATVGAELARRHGVPYAERNVFLDDQKDPKEVSARLAELEAVARRRGHAIAIGHPKDATIKALTEWLPKARVNGLMLVPLSAVVTQPRPSG
jgi:polysaccharide deacetylase 2 family uncharacterized protein YibQ